MPLSITCNARIEGHWVPMDVAEALRRGTAVTLRCPECYGPVRAHKKGTTGQAAHLEHAQGHSGCSFSGAWDRRSHSRHPLAID